MPDAPPAVIGVFNNQQQVRSAIADLVQAGFSEGQIGFVLGGGQSLPEVASDHESVGEGGIGGALAGAGIGSLLAAAGSVFIPGIGPVLAGGMLANALGGAAIGAIAGGLLGVMAGLGVTEIETHYFHNELRLGRSIVVVDARDRREEALQIMRRSGGSVNGAHDQGSHPRAA